MAEPIARSADLAPGLLRHQGDGIVSEAYCGLANSLETSLDCIARPLIAFEARAVKSTNVALDTFDVVYDVVE